MRDLAFVGFLLALIGMGFKRPFLFVLAYVYVDVVSPQRLTYILLNSVPVSLILVCLAVGAWAMVDNKADTRIAPRKILLAMLLVYCGITTAQADFPVEAFEKWSWVWKALAFAIFLPLTLRTRLRIEALVLFMVLSIGSIIIVGGIKTLAGGGGYGELNLMMDSNSGLYEGSILSTFAIAIIPLITWLARYGTIYVPDWRVRGFAVALTFACLLIPIGTQARTGLICIGVLGVMFLRQTKRRVLYLGILGAAALIVTPLLPASFTTRMNTIQGYQADSSASTRIAVWQWTIGYAKEHPFGGGFDAYRQNKLRIVKHGVATGEQQDTSTVVEYDQARAYHSSYFEMLGEQGYPGLALWLAIHLTGLLRMEILRARYRKRVEDEWISGLATALQQGQVIYLIGSLFVGIAFQPFAYLLIGLQIGLDTYAARRSREARPQGGFVSVQRAAHQSN
jgi:probable O-glycosylation ligase (exosortase A-associated)